MIHYLTKQIKNIETEILEIINHDDKLKHNLTLTLSIKGIGLQMATTMIIFKNLRTGESLLPIVVLHHSLINLGPVLKVGVRSLN